MVNTLVIDSCDSVGVALTDLPEGTRVVFDGMDGQVVITRSAIPFGHKIALVTIPRDEPVIKYGASIGLASSDILPGDHVHVHNLRSVRGAARS